MNTYKIWTIAIGLKSAILARALTEFEARKEYAQAQGLSVFDVMSRKID